MINRGPAYVAEDKRPYTAANKKKVDSKATLATNSTSATDNLGYSPQKKKFLTSEESEQKYFEQKTFKRKMKDNVDPTLSSA